MELRHLRYVVTLAETLHFGRAAARLHVSQPALSKRIRRLEERIGGPLLVRRYRDVRLTEAGRRQLRTERESWKRLAGAMAAALATRAGDV